MRRAVAAWSAQAALSEDAAADLQLLLSEATTNAVEHAYRESEAGEFVYSVRRRPTPASGWSCRTSAGGVHPRKIPDTAAGASR